MNILNSFNNLTAFSKNRLMQRIKSGAGCGTISACRNYDDDFLASLDYDEILEFYQLDDEYDKQTGKTINPQRVNFALGTDYCIQNGIKTIRDFDTYIRLHSSDNRARTMALRNDLKKLNSLGIGFVKINGVYEGSKEASFFVFNYGDKIDASRLEVELMELGRKYSQDSITFCGDGKIIDLICTTPFKMLYAGWIEGGNKKFSYGKKMTSWNGVKILETTISKIASEDGKVKESELENFPAYSQISSVPFAFASKMKITADMVKASEEIDRQRDEELRALAKKHIASKYSSTAKMRAYGRMLGVTYK